MSTELIITSSAFYRNSLYLERKMSGEVAVASGRYTTRYGIVELYGENYGKESKRKPYFSFDFTHEGRNYRCYFEEWLTDATIRLRAIRFVEQCRALAPEPVPTQWAYEQACAAIEKHRQRADTAEAQLAIKTYQGWEDGPEMPIGDYLRPGDEVDEEMVNHFGGVVSPQYCTYQFTQVGEPDHEEKGRYFYMTFGRFGDRYLYLGILPPFKQPK